MQEWVSAARAGEQAAWNVLYKQYYPALYAHALRICGNMAMAKDAVQDAFLTAFLKLPQLKDTAAFDGWIKQILIHTCYRMKHHPVNAVTGMLPCESESWWEDELNNKLEKLYTQNRLYTTLAHLPEVLRSTLLLRYFSGFQTYEEIALILAIPVGTVRSRINQAKIKLAEHWQQHTDAGIKVASESTEWNHFYQCTFGNVHRSDEAKNKLINHLKKDIEIIFTSGKANTGRNIIEREVHEDRKHGSWFEPENVISSGNISIVEARNYNSPEYPDRCPPNAVFVLYRDKQTATRINFHLL